MSPSSEGGSAYLGHEKSPVTVAAGFVGQDLRMNLGGGSAGTHLKPSEAGHGPAAHVGIHCDGDCGVCCLLVYSILVIEIIRPWMFFYLLPRDMLLVTNKLH